MRAAWLMAEMMGGKTWRRYMVPLTSMKNMLSTAMTML
jgi:hypothetical protein